MYNSCIFLWQKEPTKFLNLCFVSPPGVPITTQWGKEGYHYSIQVAQYGLSHHAKHISLEKPPEHTRVEDMQEEWKLPDSKSRIMADSLDLDKGERKVMEFLTSGLCTFIYLFSSPLNFSPHVCYILKTFPKTIEKHCWPTCIF